jgi:hypothetical protein
MTLTREERRRELAQAKRWASRIKGARSRPDKRRCAAQVCQHLRAMLTGEPADPAPGQGRLI